MPRQAPTAIITEQDKAIQNTIKVVLPKVCYFWCLWLVIEKVPQRRGYDYYETIYSILHNVMFDSFRTVYGNKEKKIIIGYNFHDK